MIKIAVVGSRGFPGVQGGVEKHCEQLYTHLVKLGCDITVFTRKSYVNPDLHTYKGVSLVTLNCPRNKYLEAIFHTFKSLFQVLKMKPDILHLHAIGPSMFALFARAMGLKVVVTNHGPDYKREKWPPPAKMFLKFCEMIGNKFANEVITIADNIADDLKLKYKINAVVIPNGVEIPQMADTEDILKRLKLQKKKYILAVGRLVPEKGLDYLIDAFSGLQVPRNYSDKLGIAGQVSNRSQVEDWKLVIAGSADHEDKYSRDLKIKAGKDKNIILTGFLTGQPLHELYSHAGLFVLPSYYEGLPIALLEAMSYGLSCIASDIPANRNIKMSEDRFFRIGDANLLAEKIMAVINEPWREEERRKQINFIAEKYDWAKIAEQTLKIYKYVVF